jgi:hypothetical protein
MVYKILRIKKARSPILATLRDFIKLEQRFSEPESPNLISTCPEILLVDQEEIKTEF